jgi:hypothetical protein
VSEQNLKIFSTVVSGVVIHEKSLNEKSRATALTNNYFW